MGTQGLRVLQVQLDLMVQQGQQVELDHRGRLAILVIQAIQEIQALLAIQVIRVALETREIQEIRVQ